MAESEMIERVARALCRHREPDCWRTHMIDARDAIEAMREPTEEMCEAGSEALDTYDPADHSPGPGNLRIGYIAMIDAALSPSTKD
jgi:hypothetical protein